jgi:hypothetical protein
VKDKEMVSALVAIAERGTYAAPAHVAKTPTQVLAEALLDLRDTVKSACDELDDLRARVEQLEEREAKREGVL